ncbi:type II toxin-antitoxin system VapC family toxin [Rhizobium panacihumi]|uniref:type II toxin-antitoxin system VapC family toxin n=1 Tax=Rhizobium panacihumi TaxID=2008450 RepID=UPI003D791938
MFIDACAVVSIMAGEDTAADYEQALSTAPSPYISPLAAWEAIIVLSRPDQLDCSYKQAAAVVTDWLDIRGIEIKESGAPRELLHHAVEVAEKHGIGKRHLSNFDCFHYAYAKTSQQPLLTMDKLLRSTDAEVLP